MRGHPKTTRHRGDYNPRTLRPGERARIELDNVTMSYPVAPLQRRSIKTDLMGFLRRTSDNRITIEQITALEGVTVTVHQGERVGLVGQNGAGKSSLLRLIAGIYLPRAGAVTVHGRVQSVFDIGIGFETHATGRDNILYRGLVMGLEPAAIRARTEEIIRFADIGEFIDMPIRSYSAGMNVRLAFAISTYLEGDILLIDEVFGAGDLAFQSKAKLRMQQLLDAARIVCFASHDLMTIRDVCTRVLWIHGNKIRADGAPAEVTKEYETAVARGFEG